jgi:hypothetical protein
MTAKLKEALDKHIPPCDVYQCTLRESCAKWMIVYQCTLRESCAKWMMSCEAFNEWIDLKPMRPPKFPEEFPSTETFLEMLDTRCYRRPASDTCYRG